MLFQMVPKDMPRGFVNNGAELASVLAAAKRINSSGVIVMRDSVIGAILLMSFGRTPPSLLAFGEPWYVVIVVKCSRNHGFSLPRGRSAMGLGTRGRGDLGLGTRVGRYLGLGIPEVEEIWDWIFL